MKSFWYYDSPIGRLCIGANETCITAVTFGETEGIKKKTPLIDKAIQQLNEYFSGTRHEFDLPLEVLGTEFQKNVWNELCKIPYGKTCSYKDIAVAIINPKASRAVGMANNKNKLLIIIPCHRVIGADGSLGGYSPGIEIKKALLKLEKEHR